MSAIVINKLTVDSKANSQFLSIRIIEKMSDDNEMMSSYIFDNLNAKSAELTPNPILIMGINLKEGEECFKNIINASSRLRINIDSNDSSELENIIDLFIQVLNSAKNVDMYALVHNQLIIPISDNYKFKSGDELIIKSECVQPYLFYQLIYSLISTMKISLVAMPDGRYTNFDGSFLFTSELLMNIRNNQFSRITDTKPAIIYHSSYGIYLNESSMIMRINPNKLRLRKTFSINDYKHVGEEYSKICDALITDLKSELYLSE